MDMYLKSIEVNGFKSFAHKMIFKFEHGITGIVGPNGSGKSNVADAVRWVLGEQRAKQLRGSRMEDVIFSGTELRKPMGSAYVAITLDNSDHSLPIQFEEVTVARRVYRSGESEYLINGSACRRKDIVELFFDTGIGKEGYSIIGQGQIEQILSGKPEERRELFDEAAGIVKYKKNKLETQKSLEIERENLVRVTDILTELERQVGPLKKQSERAREYLLLRDQLKDEDVKLFLLENQNLEKELKELDEKTEIAQREINEANQTLAKAKEKYGKQEEFLDHLKQEIETITAHISEMKLTKQKKEGKIQVLNEQINTEHMRESMYLFGYPSVFFRFIHPRLNLQTLFFCCQSLTITGKQFFYSIIISFIHILILLPFTIRQGRLVGFLNQISFFFIKSLFSYKKAIFAVKYQTNT